MGTRTVTYWPKRGRRTAELSAPDQRVLTAIREWFQHHEYSPSFRDLCALTGMTSTSQISRAITSLAKQGKITYAPNVARSVRLVEGGN